MRTLSLVVCTLLAIAGLGPTVKNFAQDRRSGGVGIPVFADNNVRAKSAAVDEDADLGANDRSDNIASPRRGGSGEILSEPQSQGDPSISLFSQTNHRGNPRNFSAPVPRLSSANRRVASLIIRGGAWQLCRGNNFTGRCITLDHSVRDLSSLNMRNRVASLRPVVVQPR